MKTIQITIFLLLNSFILLGQIKNAGFEIAEDSMNITPHDWVIRKAEGFKYYLDSKVNYQGDKSLVIKSLHNVESQSYLPFSQIVAMDVPSLKRMRVSVFIKSDSIIGGAALWSQILDSNKKMLGFYNSSDQSRINGTSDWKEYSMDMTLNSNCKYLVIGGYLQGKGTIWFDNYILEDIVLQNETTSKKVKRFEENLYHIVRKNSIYTDSLDWNTLKVELDHLSRGVTNIEDVSFISSYVINKLREVGDNHSFVLSKQLSETNTKVNTDGRLPSGKVLENNIGYIWVPGFTSSNDTSIQNFANKIQNLIRTIDFESHIQGWILDLRENTGGNMYPMIAGLGPIIGEGTLGYIIKPNRVKVKWFYQNGECGYGNKAYVKVSNPYIIKSTNAKVAVLIGGSTGSSGEMTAISFIGKPNTKLFGQKSAGYITANSAYKLLDGSTLSLATGYAADRNSKKYVSPIIPDVTVEDDNKVVQTAIDWIIRK